MGGARVAGCARGAAASSGATTASARGGLMTRRNEGGATTAPRRLRWTLLLVAALWPPDGARAGVEPVAPAEPARLLTIDARLGAGGDTNVTRDPEASTRGAVARVELHGALATRHLQLEVGSWFHQYLP